MVKRTTVVLEESLLKHLKQRALNDNMTMTQVMTFALWSYLNLGVPVIERQEDEE